MKILSFAEILKEAKLEEFEPIPKQLATLALRTSQSANNITKSNMNTFITEIMKRISDMGQGEQRFDLKNNNGQIIQKTPEALNAYVREVSAIYSKLQPKIQSNELLNFREKLYSALAEYLNIQTVNKSSDSFLRVEDLK